MSSPMVRLSVTIATRLLLSLMVIINKIAFYKQQIRTISKVFEPILGSYFTNNPLVSFNGL
jgi:hypothetical protein